MYDGYSATPMGGRRSWGRALPPKASLGATFPGPAQGGTASYGQLTLRSRQVTSYKADRYSHHASGKLPTTCR